MGGLCLRFHPKWSEFCTIVHLLYRPYNIVIHWGSLPRIEYKNILFLENWQLIEFGKNVCFYV